MPKRGKNNNWKNYHEHDYRGGGDNNQRRVTFKPNKGNRYDRNQKDWGETIKIHLQDEDMDMVGSTSNFKTLNHKKFPKKRNRPGSPMPQLKVGGKRRLVENPLMWYRVYLPFGNKYDKQFIQKSLNDRLQPSPFIPLCWSTMGNACTFYIDEFKVAEKISNLDKQIQLPDGFNLMIRVSNGLPIVDVTADVKEKMKLAMAKKYNPDTKALDLTKFHIDPDLQNVFCGLFKPVILQEVFSIIAENIPDLEALNLFENKIHIIRHLKNLSTKLPNLKILHMGNNKIREMMELDALNGVPVVDLVLDGNPVCDKFSDRDTYISEVRKRLPKVMKLDGVDLPPPISFDIQSEGTLPTSQQTYLCNNGAQEIVAQFLEKYFTIMDGDDRSLLLDAYHEDALYSTTVCYPYGQHPKNSPWLNWYQTDNRNLKRVTDNERRHKLLRHGRHSIVSYLNEMPKTTHDMMSFTVDLNQCLPTMLLLTVTGMYKEVGTGHKTPPVRYFFRTMVIVPAGAGFCIANEEFHATNATDKQMRLAFKTPTPAPTLPDVVVGAAPPPPTTAATEEPAHDIEAKKRMVEAVSQQSGMNLEWSEMCLSQSNWNLLNAMANFTQAQADGKIPIEAFNKENDHRILQSN